jgi:hypothetical protein
MSAATFLHIIYLKDAMVLSKKPYESRRDIQNEYGDFKTSLGPWSVEEVIAFLEIDFGKNEGQWPFSRKQIEDFSRSDLLTLSAR